MVKNAAKGEPEGHQGEVDNCVAEAHGASDEVLCHDFDDGGGDGVPREEGDGGGQD